MSKRRVLVAMSGGVDSSIAAALLSRQGYDVIGVTMDLFEKSCQIEDPNNCCSLAAFEDARSVAQQLGIPHYILDLREEFEKDVISYFVNEYLEGRTPNPCVRCNEAIKFGALLEKAREFEADFVGTGHYTRIEYDDEKGSYSLKKGKDLAKDQSYVLCRLRQDQLKHLLFPLGGLTKQEVRKMAHDFGMRIHDKPDSQEICFASGDGYRVFLERRGISAKPGPIIDKQGKVLGSHNGIYSFTIGQRRGLELATTEPLYVIKIDKGNNTVVVGEKEDLLQNELVACDVNWIAGYPPQESFSCLAKIRHTHPEAPAIVFPSSDGAVRVRFERPQSAITPGQVVAFYQGDTVLGGGWIN